MSSVYHYTARSEWGAIVTGTMLAASAMDAAVQLRARRLFVTSVDDERNIRGRAKTLVAFVAIQHGGARLAFFRALAVLVGAGTSLRRSLALAIEECRDARFGEALGAVAADVDAGSALSEAMSRRPAEFSARVVAMVRAGEVGGVLEEVLERCASMLEREAEMQRKIVSAVTYPAFVLAASAGLIAFLLVVTVPSLATMFADLHAPLPLSTRLMIEASEALRSPPAYVIAVALAATGFAAIVAARRSRAVRASVDRGLLRLPVVGRLLRSAVTARCLRTAGTLIHCGVPIREALVNAARVAGSETYRASMAELVRLLSEGMSFALAMRRVGTFDHMCVGLAAIGEESGTLDAMLLRAAERNEIAVASALTVITSIIEPAMILLLGGAVGSIVASIILPLYAAIGNIR